MPSTPESGSRAGYDAAKRRRGANVHMAVDTLGNRLAVLVTPANAQDRHHVAALAQQVQELTGDAVVELACVDQGYTGQQAAEDAKTHHMTLEVGKLAEATRGLVWLPRRWVVERRHGWAARLRRLARDYAQLAETRKALPVVAFAMLMLRQFTVLILQSA